MVYGLEKRDNAMTQSVTVFIQFSLHCLKNIIEFVVAIWIQLCDKYSRMRNLWFYIRISLLFGIDVPVFLSFIKLTGNFYPS